MIRIVTFLAFVALLGLMNGCDRSGQPKLDLLHNQLANLPEPDIQYGFDFNAFHVVEGAFKPGDVLSKVLFPLGVGPTQLEQLVDLCNPHFDVRKIKPEQKWISLFESDSASTPNYFIFEKNRREYVVFSIADSLAVWTDAKPVQKTRRTVSGRITRSLYHTLADIGVTPEIAAEMSSIYAWTIDFYRLQADDHFQLLFEESTIDGEPIGENTILACSFTHKGKERKAYRFELDGAVNYFDNEGESMRKAFLKAPVKFSRISSRFSGKRFHPVLKRYKAHLGTDYAAPHGTPIVAVGDGTVSASSFTSGNGNYVKIRHNSTYETQYLHMSKRAVKAGDRVQQGDVIGYVGSTGLATGPHVCFRFWKNGQQVDHLSEEFPASEPIPAAQMESFNLVKAQFDAWMNNTYDEQPKVSFIPSDSSAVL